MKEEDPPVKGVAKVIPLFGPKKAEQTAEIKPPPEVVETPPEAKAFLSTVPERVMAEKLEKIPVQNTISGEDDGFWAEALVFYRKWWIIISLLAFVVGVAIPQIISKIFSKL